MKLYDGFISSIISSLPDNGKVFPLTQTKLCMSERNPVLLLKDTAYELGGSSKNCVSTLAVTSGMSFGNEIVLYGKDLNEIKEDCNFGKIVFLEIEDVSEEEAFEKIKELELIRFKCCPDGFMTRASALNMREQLRVSKKAVKKGISFSDYGSFLINEYLKYSNVKSVKIIFITDTADFDFLYNISEKIKSTTSALNHIFDNILFDCSSCNLKEICDEVDGMKELHKKQFKK